MTKKKPSMPKPINPNDFVSENFRKKREELQKILWKKLEENEGNELQASDEVFVKTMHAYHALQSYKKFIIKININLTFRLKGLFLVK